MQFAASRHHRASVGPSRRRTVQINCLCSGRGIGGTISSVKTAWTSAHDQHFAIVVHYCRSPITSPVIAIRHRTPSTSASNIKIPCDLARPSTEHLSIRRSKHEWIKSRQSQMRRSQVAPGCCCALPYLRLHIDIIDRIDRATDHEDISIGQRGVRRIPSSIVHVRQPRPGIVQRVIRVGIGQPHKVVSVSTGYKKLSIGQKGMAGTENVCSWLRS
jgi:hypothetical protein